jgi:hypothetical protein
MPAYLGFMPSFTGGFRLVYLGFKKPNIRAGKLQSDPSGEISENIHD